MNICTQKKTFLTVALVLLSTICYATVKKNDGSNEVEGNVDRQMPLTTTIVDNGIADITLIVPNTLRYMLADLDVTTIITHLKLHGKLGSDDLAVIHSHTGRLMAMEILDLSDVILVADEGQYAFISEKNGIGISGGTFNTYFLSNRNETITTKETTLMGDLLVYNDIYTTDLGGLLFNCTSVKKVLLPKVLRSIGDHIFSNCSALEEVVIQNESEISTVKDDAFKYCSNLTNLCLSELRTIGKHAFEGAQVRDIELKNVTLLDELSFSSTKGLKKADLSSLTAVPEHAFAECYDLKEVTWGNKLETISDGAFRNCNIETVDLPASLQKVYANAFDGTLWLSEQENTVTEGIIYAGKVALKFAPKWQIPENTTLIIADGTTATSLNFFPNSCSDNITKIIMPKSMKYFAGIDGYNVISFAGLKEMELPEGLCYIGPNAFRGAQLLEVCIPSSVTEIGFAAFADMEKLLNVEYNAKGEITESRIFSNCKALEKVTFGTDVNNVPDYMFEGCASLINVEFANDEEQEDETDSKRLCIGSGGFYGCAALTNFTFPSNLDSIGGDAFRGTGLIKVELPQGTRSIGCAFRCCSQLTEIVFPKSMSGLLKEDTFYGTSLRKIYDYHAMPLQIEYDDIDNTFRETLSRTVTVYVMPEYIEAYKSDPIWKYLTIEVMDEEHQASSINNENISFSYNDVPSYDLQGRRLANPVPLPIFIKNGKKYFE